MEQCKYYSWFISRKNKPYFFITTWKDQTSKKENVCLSNSKRPVLLNNSNKNNNNKNNNNKNNNNKNNNNNNNNNNNIKA